MTEDMADEMADDFAAHGDLARLPLDDAYALEIYPDGTVQLHWTDDDDRQMSLTRGHVETLAASGDPRLDRWRAATVIRGIGAPPSPNPFAAWGLEAAGARTTAVLADWTWQLVARSPAPDR